MIHIELTGVQGLWLLGIGAAVFALIWIADYYYWPFVKWRARRAEKRRKRRGD